MPFVEILPNKMTSISVRANEASLSTKALPYGRVSVVIYLGPALAAACAAKLGVRKGSALTALWGTDEHLGLLRIKRSSAPRHWKWTVYPNGMVRIQIGNLPEAYQGRKFSREKIKVEAIDGLPGRSDPFLSVTLPPKFYNEPAPEVPEADGDGEA